MPLCIPVPPFPAPGTPRGRNLRLVPQPSRRASPYGVGSKAFPALPPEGETEDAVLRRDRGQVLWFLSGAKGQSLGFPLGLRAGDGFGCLETWGEGNNGQPGPHILLVCGDRAGGSVGGHP